MKKLLLVTGDLAAGKSTFARILAKRYQVTALCKDDVKEVLSDVIGYTNRAENKKLSAASVEMMRFVLSVVAQAESDLILEADFHEEELAKIHGIASEQNYEVLTLVLRGDVDLLYQRYLYRAKNENRHPTHLSATLDVYENFKSTTDFRRTEIIPGDTIEVMVDDFAYQEDPVLLEKIDAFMGRKEGEKWHLG